nr:DEAD-box ATP-dependent RNA helicase 53-like [Ipomoea batatas]GMD28673.1 DEAD-box ATP-dependent RNA helicase 53-like [Ipomoea batatas]
MGLTPLLMMSFDVLFSPLYVLLSQIHHFDSIDLKSLQAEHFRNVIPPASRSSNYTVLRSRNFPLSTVGDSDQKLADGIPLYSIACEMHSKPAIFGPLITEHAKRGKCIVFTQTKRDVDRLAYAMQRSHGCEALHGDISQN